MFKNTTGYNKKLLTTFQISHMIRRQLLVNVLLIIIFVLLIILADLFKLREMDDFTWMIVCFYALFLALLTLFQAAYRIKKGLKSGILRMHYDFSETTLKVTSANEHKDIMVELPYSEIKSIVTYKYIIMFYISNNCAYVMDKNGFTVGDFESFKDFIKQKITKHNL